MAILHLQEPYRLIPETAPSKPLAIRGPDGADVYSNDFLPGRPAGPTRPDEPILAPEKDPNEVPLSEAERNKLRALAKEFGFGGETLVNQYQVRKKKRSQIRCSCSRPRWQGGQRAFGNFTAEQSAPAPVKKCSRQVHCSVFPANFLYTSGLLQ